MAREKTILLVDDDKDFVASNTDLLEAYGYTVFQAYDGTSAFLMAKSEQPDLIVLDVMMAYETEGLDLARKIRTDENLKETKILLVSGISREMRLGFSLHPDDMWLPVTRVMEKPIIPTRFISEVQKMIGNA